MLAIEPLKIGQTILWDIEDILTRTSCDVSSWYVEEMESEGLDLRQAWLRKLEYNRQDRNYHDVVESIRERGFLRPLTARIGGGLYDTDSYLHFGDGHHRLAAAIDLGLNAVPVYIGDNWVISTDSGSWSRGKHIQSLEEILNRWR